MRRVYFVYTDDYDALRGARQDRGCCAELPQGVPVCLHHGRSGRKVDMAEGRPSGGRIRHGGYHPRAGRASSLDAVHHLPRLSGTYGSHRGDSAYMSRQGRAPGGGLRPRLLSALRILTSRKSADASVRSGQRKWCPAAEAGFPLPLLCCRRTSRSVRCSCRNCNNSNTHSR